MNITFIKTKGWDLCKAFHNYYALRKCYLLLQMLGPPLLLLLTYFKADNIFYFYVELTTLSKGAASQGKAIYIYLNIFGHFFLAIRV